MSKNSSFAPKRRKQEEDNNSLNEDEKEYESQYDANSEIENIKNESTTIIFNTDNEKINKEIASQKAIIEDMYNRIISIRRYNKRTAKGYIIQAKVALSKLKHIHSTLAVKEEKKFSCSLDKPENYAKKREEVIKKLLSMGLKSPIYIVDYFKVDVNTTCPEDEIAKRILLKFELIDQGHFSDYELKDIIIDYISFDDIEDLGIEFVADTIRDFEKYKRTSYTPKQLIKSYKQVSESFIINNYNKGSDSGWNSRRILDYIIYFKNNPIYMLRTFLWIDTFHDFKGARIGSKLNNIIREFFPNKTDYAFDEMYRDSFFTFNKNNKTVDDLKSIIKTKQEELKLNKTNEKSLKAEITEIKKQIKLLKQDIVTGFVKDIDNTVLKGINNNVAQLLYDVSEIIINKTEFESDLFYAYMLVNFNFDIPGKYNFMNDLKNVLWNQIGSEDVPYYAKDVDRGSGNLLQGNLIILPASLFDANSSNSSDNGINFVEIKKTIIPFANGYDFNYEFEISNDEKMEGKKKDKKDCEFKLNYTNGSEVYTLKNTCHGSYDDSIKLTYKDLDKAVNDKNYTEIKDIIKKLYFKNGKVNLHLNTKGMSPEDIVIVIIGLLEDNKGNYKCDILDFWVSLKRIGDYGQILQCKQVGIPLFTTDSMQLLISLAVKSSVVWSPDFSKVYFYNANIDSIMCNGLNPLENKLLCSKKRINKIDVIEDSFLYNKIYNSDDLLKTTVDKTNKVIEELDSIPNIRN